ncbi:MAG: HAMP domain-containing histidine kinase [Candidatus Omnitrophica bacterium]|nr:HAMP domain-containing histidine kinase [Candidatus Omnitrophota bacterium]
MKKMRPHDEYYNKIIEELDIDPIRMIKAAFALMGIIPILVIFYIITKRQLFGAIFLGKNGLIAAIAIFISVIGFFYAYIHIRKMAERLLIYSAGRKRADEEKSAFVSNVSHEFRNPLAVVKESLSLILDGTLGKIDSKQREVLEISKSTIDRLARLVIDLLNLSKIEAGKIELKKEEVDIASLVNEVVKTYERELFKKEIALKKNIPPDIGKVFADRDRLSEVIINLLNNAIKYAPAKGSIIVDLEGSKKEIRFAISDTGPGMSKENCKKIFNKFERVTTGGEKGTGLGLPIAKDIIGLHKGRIWVESELGRGSTFTFALPRKAV